MRKCLILILTIIGIVPGEFSEGRSQWVQTNWPEEVLFSVFHIGAIGSTLYAATGAALYSSLDSGMTWAPAGDDPVTSNIIGLVRVGQYLFAGRLHGGVIRSPDSGKNWIAMNHGLTDTTILSIAADTSEETSKMLFVGIYKEGVFRSTDFGANWEALNAGLRDLNVRSLIVLGSILIAGTDSGVFFSKDGGLHWAGGPISASHNSIATLAVSGSKADVGIVFAGTADGGLFRSRDAGISWQFSDIGFSDTIIRWLLLAGSRLFAITNNGIRVSLDSGITWSRFDQGLGANTVLNEFVRLGTWLYSAANTGVWKRSLSDFVSVPLLQLRRSVLRAFPNPSSAASTIRLTAQSRGHAEITILNLLGQQVAELFNGELEAGEHPFTWDAHLMPAGIYLCLLRSATGIEEMPIELVK